MANVFGPHRVYWRAADYHAATVTLSMLGKLFISITFAAVYVHASELLPTEVRNVGVGSASMCARISSMAAAYVGGPLVGHGSHLIILSCIHTLYYCISFFETVNYR